MRVQSYLSFEGRTEEAPEFYQSAVRAEIVSLIRFKDSPDQSMVSPGFENKVMHSTFRIGETILMASDGRNSGQPSFAGISLSLVVQSDSEAELLFTALADGGQVQMPLTKTFFSSQFGMVADRFGVSWMVVVMP